MHIVSYGRAKHSRHWAGKPKLILNPPEENWANIDFKE